MSARLSAAALTAVILASFVHVATGQSLAIDPATRPDVSQDTSPLHVLNPIAKDGHTAFDGRAPNGRWQHSPAAASAFRDADQFFRRHIVRQPVPIAPSLVKYVPLETR
jgi:hypothetical protein